MARDMRKDCVACSIDLSSKNWTHRKLRASMCSAANAITFCNVISKCAWLLKTVPFYFIFLFRMQHLFVTVCVSIYLPILLETSKEVILVPVPVEVWQAEHLRAPKPFYWPADQVTQLLDIAEGSMYVLVSDFHRIRVLISTASGANPYSFCTCEPKSCERIAPWAYSLAERKCVHWYLKII